MTNKAILAQLSGVVTTFQGNGRKLGYPTANLKTKISLQDGVYFGFADLGKYTHHPALIFVGQPITVGDAERRVEAHLLDVADKDYYGQTLRLQISHFHRPNQLFASVDELVVAMKSDEASARRWFDLQDFKI